MKRLRFIILILIVFLFIFVGISLYNLPYKSVNNYININTKNEFFYSESISHFLSYNEENNLPEPTVTLKTIRRTINEADILATFEIFNYNDNYTLTNVYSGSLLFSLVYSKWNWKIDSITVISDMSKN